MTARDYRCSFCGKGQEQVKKLIAGQGVYICNECAALVNGIVEEDLSGPKARTVLTHIDGRGQARMVDVGRKEASERRATARGFVRLSPATVQLVRDGKTPKGEVLGVARVAGIMAAKKTSELIPMTHPLPLTHVSVDLKIEDGGIAIEATAATTAQTGVEMEALTAVTVAALTLYDMLKAVEREARITDVRLVEKSGGKSGHITLE